MDEPPRILAVDDDEELLAMIDQFLTDSGYSVSVTSEGQQAVAALESSKFELAILDINLPDIDGLTLTRMFKAKSNAGIIILSGRGETPDRIIGLETGADDYLAKPFELRELLARIRSVLRRTNGAAPSTDDGNHEYRFDGWMVNEATRTLSDPEQNPVDLTTREFEMLLTFVKHPNRVLTREQILDLSSRADRPVYDRSVDTMVARLRRKLEADPANPKILTTVTGVGYMLKADVRIQ